jgi:hypothetical protein
MLKRNVRGGVPSPYPRFLFHGLRCAQLIAAVVVSGIMSYFVYYLRTWAIPATFTCYSSSETSLTVLNNQDWKNMPSPGLL